MNVKDKIEKIQEDIFKLQEELKSLNGVQNIIYSKKLRINEINKFLNKVSNEEQEILRQEQKKLNDEILDIEWQAKSYQERLEMRKHNLMYFRKLEYPNFKEENYIYEYTLIRYTETLIKVINLFDEKHTHFSNISMQVIRKALSTELKACLMYRNKITLQEKKVFRPFDKLVATYSYRGKLTTQEREVINCFLLTHSEVHSFQQEEVKFR